MRTTESLPRLWIIVPAAGSGKRMAAQLAKQYLPLNHRSVLAHTLTMLLQADGLHQILVALDSKDNLFDDLAESSHPLVSRVAGGAERVDSVLNALQSIAATAAANDWVLVHDAARPCLCAQDLNQFIATVSKTAVGGIMAVPVADTLKRVDPASLTVVTTQDRSVLWSAQTPQMFRYGELLSSLQSAIAAGVTITDESSAMEWAGFKPHVVMGQADNLKITRPADLRLAEFILMARGPRPGVEEER